MPSSAARHRRVPIAVLRACRSWSSARWHALPRCSRKRRANRQKGGCGARRGRGASASMRLDEEEDAMLAGAMGPARQWAIKHQLAVGTFFDAPDFVRVGQAHIMADTESLGVSGVTWLETLAALPQAQCRVLIPTITDPRGLDFSSYKRLRQTEAMAELE